MNNFIDKLKKRSHRRQGSSTSQISSKSNDSTSLAAGDESPTSGLPESPSFYGTLTLVDPDSPSTTKANVDFCSDMRQADLGVSSMSRENGRSLRKRHSRITRTLDETLADPSALAYFLTFMVKKSRKHLVNFWLEAESFRLTAQITATRIEAEERDGHSIASLRKMTGDDAMAVFSKYCSKDQASFLGIDDSMLHRIINKICSDDKKVDADCFLEAQTFIFSALQRDHVEFVQSVQYFAHVLDVLNGDDVEITDILYDQTALFYFVEFLEQDRQRCLIEFWMQTQHFKEKMAAALESDNFDVEQAQNDAMVLYDRFFSMQAECPLGFGDDVRIEVENNICRDNNLGPSLDCFDKSLKCVLNLLQQKYLPRFLGSDFIKKYKRKLEQSIECELDLPNGESKRKPRKSGSECSSSDKNSESSFTNSRLMRKQEEIAIKRKELNIANGESLSVDCRPCDDPDLLWKRGKTKMSLGYMDEVGRYISSVEGQPLRNKSNKLGGDKIKVAMKKFISGDTRKEEELAERAAALIVQDVQNMTRAFDDNDCHLTKYA